MARDISDVTDFSKSGNVGHPSGGLIKIKDREGFSPFEVYGATIASRDIKRITSSSASLIPSELEHSDIASDAPSLQDDSGEDSCVGRGSLNPRTNLAADEVFTFGSNKNLNLGLGDQDDRQFPVRINLERPEHLLRRFYREFLDRQSDPHPPRGRESQRHKHALNVPLLKHRQNSLAPQTSARAPATKPTATRTQKTTLHALDSPPQNVVGTSLTISPWAYRNQTFIL